MASSALMQNKNVLYITLEMSEERIAERIDANILNIPMKELPDISKKEYGKKIGRLKNKTKGKLIVKEYPTASAHVGHFRHVLQELNIKKDFQPDIIFVDYLNICASQRIRPGAGANSYTLVKSIAEELRGLAVEHDLPIVSATQTTRSGYGSTDIGLEDTSESFGLPATADLMFALITSEELEDLDQLVVKQLKNRYNDPTIFKRFVIGIDRSRMKLYDVEQEAQEELIEGDTLIDDDIPVADRGRDKVSRLEMMEPFVQKQYDEYQANRTEKEIVSEKTLRDAIIKDLSFVSKMGVAEYTLYQKYQEIHLKYPSQTVQTLYGEETNFVNEDHLKLITETKNNIWFPNSYEDFEKLEPELVYTDSEKDRQSVVLLQRNGIVLEQ